MEMTPVTSSCLSAVGYDPATGTMRLSFAKGGTYDYHVPASEHAALMEAGSMGSHFQKHIRTQHIAHKVG